MKKINLKVVVEDDEAIKVLDFLQSLKISNICDNVIECSISMEQYGVLPYGPTYGEIENG